MWLEAFLILTFSLVLFGIYWFFLPWIQSLNTPHPLSLDLAFINTQCPVDQQGNLVRSPFTNIFNDPLLHLSVILPIYNNEKNLIPILQNTISFLQKRYSLDPKFTSEIIIINDGSNDNSANICIEFALKYTSEFIRYLHLPLNQGKGNAIRLGSLHSRGRYILCIGNIGPDCDESDDCNNNYNSINFDQYHILESSLLNNQIIPSHKFHAPLQSQSRLGLAIGSYKSLNYGRFGSELFDENGNKQQPQQQQQQQQQQQKTSSSEEQFSNILNFFTKNITNLDNIYDTQYTFKLFTRETCKYIFLNQNIQTGKSCDLEILFLAKKFQIPICQVPMRNSTGSPSPLATATSSVANSTKKITKSSLSLFTNLSHFSQLLPIIRDIFMIRILYTFGLWRIIDPERQLGYGRPYWKV